MFAKLPVTALRTFEAAARLGSFKQAAAELLVTPTAVSHQIKVLEQRLGLALFERVPRGVVLTAKGRYLFERVHDALLEMSQTLDMLRPERSEGELALTTTHSFAALWLVPRLGAFQQRYPGYQVNLRTSGRVVDLLQDASVDLAIRYGSAVYPGLHCASVLEESFGVYGTPKVVAQAALAQPDLISVHWRDSTLYDQGWSQWCAAAGVGWLEGCPTLRSYEEEHYALQAAIAGQGLVLASSVMVSASVGHGLLVPLRPDVKVPGSRYSVLCVPGRERHPPLRAFLDWFVQESGAL